MHRSPMNAAAVHPANPPPPHGSGLGQDARLLGPDITDLRIPDAIDPAVGCERAHGGMVGWTGGAQLQCATVQFGRLMVHLVVEELGETGWDWHVWVQGGWTWSRYGLADTAGDAREQAERALAGLMRSVAAGNASLCPNCLFPQRST